MHSVAHAVEVPLEQLKRILKTHAQRDFTGSVEIDMRVHAESLRFVEMEPETHEAQRVQANNSPEWKEIGTPRVPKPQIDRDALVDKMIADNTGKIRLASSVRKIVAHFVMGELRNMEWFMPGDARVVMP